MSSDHPVVEIPPRYIRSSLRHARKRNESFKQDPSYRDRIKNSDRHPAVDNYIGVIGEIGFAIYADLQIDSNVYERGDDGYDFRVSINGDPVTLDVKTRTGDIFAFWVKENNLNADYYVVGCLDAPIEFDAVTLDVIDNYVGWKMTFKGSGTKEEFLKAPQVDSDMGWTNRSILLDDLRPIPSPEEIKPID